MSLKRVRHTCTLKEYEGDSVSPHLLTNDLYGMRLEGELT